MTRIRHELAGRSRWVTRRLQEFRDSVGDPTKKPVAQQFREMLRLRLSTTALSPLEYHEYGLHDLTVVDGVDLRNVCGSRMRVRLDRDLNSPAWEAATSDKVLASMIYHQARIPHPDLYAVFSRYDRSCGGAPVLRDHDELMSYLLGEDRYPMFCKPVQGMIGASCHRIDSVDPGTRTIRIDGGAPMSIEHYVAQLHDPSGWGFLFQEMLRPSPETIPIAGPVVTGLRMIVLLADDGPTLFQSIWKIPVAGNVTDNFGQGNAAAKVDVQTGRVLNVHWGTRSTRPVNAPHPDTGTRIAGLRVPMWDEAREVAFGAAPTFPGFRFQHWDIGLTDRGPIVYELNPDGGLWDDIPGNLGTYDDRLRAFHARYSGTATQHVQYRGPRAAR